MRYKLMSILLLAKKRARLIRISLRSGRMPILISPFGAGWPAFQLFPKAHLFECARAVVHQNGPALVGFAVKYDYTWGKGCKVVGDKSP